MFNTTIQAESYIQEETKQFIIQNNILQSFENLGIEGENIHNIIKLIILTEKIKNNQIITSFPSEEEVNEYLLNNQELSTQAINKILQNNFMREIKIICGLFKIKTMILNEEEQRILNVYKKEIKNIFVEAGFSTNLNDLNKEQIKQNKISQIRVLGTNNILLEPQLVTLKKELKKLQDENLLHNDYKILLLGGVHTNSEFNEDLEPEIEMMYKLSNKILGKEYSKKIVKITTPKKGFFVKTRPNTIDTIILANKLQPTDNSIIYVGMAPVLQRQIEDMKVKNLYNENIYAIAPSYEYIEYYLTEKLNFLKKDEREFEIIELFLNKLSSSFLLDQFARNIYAKNIQLNK